jgi:hypothetical protein
MSDKNTINRTKIITGKCRLSYAHLFEPSAMQDGDDEKYSACIIIPKSDKDTLAKIKTAIDAATQDGIKSKWKGNRPPESKFKLPLRDGDEERPDDDAFAGCYFMNANSKQRPAVFDRYKTEVYDAEEVYSGCFCRFSVTFYPFSVKGNNGVACGLNGVQKVADGVRLGGRGNVRADFDDEFEEFEDDDLDGLM